MRGRLILNRFHTKEGVAIATLALITLAVVSYQLFRVPEGNPNKALKKLALHPLWDVNSEDIRDWQVLINGRQLIAGPDDWLIVSDRSGPGVYFVSVDGSRGFRVGREGQGPGEYRQPTDLAWQADRNALWVVDRTLSRVQKWTVTQGDPEFITGATSPSFRLGTISSGIAVASDTTVWFSPRLFEDRLHLVTLSGTTARVAGEQWLPDGDVAGSEWIYNQNSIVDVPGNKFLVIWHTRPLVELWADSGDFIRSFELTSPTIEARKDLPLQELEIPHYIRCGTVDELQNKLILALYGVGNETPLMVIDLATGSTGDGYLLPTSSDNDIISIAVSKSSPGKIYALDRKAQVILEADLEN